MPDDDADLMPEEAEGWRFEPATFTDVVCRVAWELGYPCRETYLDAYETPEGRAKMLDRLRELDERSNEEEAREKK